MSDVDSKIMPKIYSDVTLEQYQHSDNELGLHLISFAPDQYLSDSFVYNENWEIFTVDPESKQVALRISYKVDWVSKPWGFWRLINRAIQDKVAVDMKAAREWFDMRATDFLDYSGSVSQLSSE